MVYKHAIFMRLGINPASGLSGLHTIREYEVFVAQYGEAWFPVSAGAGMSERMRCEFQDAIDYHYALELYLSVGKEAGLDYVAEVKAIAMGKERIPTPSEELTPEPWRADLRGTWLKIRSLKPAELTAGDFTVINTGARLSDVLSGGKYHFGYVKRVGE
jgi:hypothetical protein